MAEQKKRHEVGEKELVEMEPVKEIEIETKDIVATSKLWIYIIIGLLVYMMFFIIPEINEKVTWMEKRLKLCIGTI